MSLSDERGRLRAAHPGVRDEQTAAVLGALSPTARRILKAAFRVLERDGYEGLSLRRIAAEAGETRSLIAYHFENKAGLVTTLVDSLWHDADVALEQEVEGLAADARGRLLALTGLHLRLAQQPGLNRTYFDLLPHILRDDEARSRLTRTYRSYRRIGELCLAPVVGDKAGPLALATLLLAAGDGVAVQTLLSGDHEAATRAFDLLERRVGDCLGLDPLVAADQGSGGPRPARASSPATSAEEEVERLAGMRDPATGLTSAAREILRGAVRLLNEDGPQALTAEALARASGQPTSSIFYHFGDKHGLLSAVLAASDYRFATVLGKASRPFVSRSPDPCVVADVMAKIFAQPGWMRAFFDVLPIVVRDAEMCRQEAAFMATARGNLSVFLRRGGVPAVEAGDLAVVCLAVTHGLGAQRLVDPRGTPVAQVIDTLRMLLARSGERARRG